MQFTQLWSTVPDHVKANHDITSCCAGYANPEGSVHRRPHGKQLTPVCLLCILQLGLLTSPCICSECSAYPLICIGNTTTADGLDSSPLACLYGRLLVGYIRPLSTVSVCVYMQVITSIHQPRSSIFAMFDDLILLSDGQLLYNGPAADALEYFEQQGFKCPGTTTDHCIDASFYCKRCEA